MRVGIGGGEGDWSERRRGNEGIEIIERRANSWVRGIERGGAGEERMKEKKDEEWGREDKKE
jgi:hypothetical protein